MRIVFKQSKSDMTLKDAVKHAREQAKELGNSQCGAEHTQLAEWLEELDQFKEAGRSFEKGITEEDVDPEQLKMGIKIEMEHTTNKDTSKRIALDHLSEIPDYYTRLVKMEKEAGVED